MAPHPLEPDETIQKILISTTSRFIGEFKVMIYLLHTLGNISQI